MFRLWNKKEKTRFESAKAFREIRTTLDAMHKQCAALKYAGEKEGVGSLSEMKFKIMNDVLDKMDKQIAGFNEDGKPEKDNVNTIEQRELLIKLSDVLNNVSKEHADLLNSNRSGMKDTAKGVAMVGAFAAPVAAGLALPATLLGTVICTYVGFQVGASAANGISKMPKANTRSQELVNSLTLQLNNVYRSLAFNLTPEQVKAERKRALDLDSSRSESTDENSWSHSSRSLSTSSSY